MAQSGSSELPTGMQPGWRRRVGSRTRRGSNCDRHRRPCGRRPFSLNGNVNARAGPVRSWLPLPVRPTTLTRLRRSLVRFLERSSGRCPILQTGRLGLARGRTARIQALDPRTIRRSTSHRQRTVRAIDQPHPTPPDQLVTNTSPDTEWPNNMARPHSRGRAIFRLWHELHENDALVIYRFRLRSTNKNGPSDRKPIVRAIL
jgi:hypothetical protein